MTCFESILFFFVEAFAIVGIFSIVGSNSMLVTDGLRRDVCAIFQIKFSSTTFLTFDYFFYYLLSFYIYYSFSDILF